MKKMISLVLAMSMILTLSCGFSAIPAMAEEKQDAYVYLSISNDADYVTSDDSSQNPGKKMVYVPVKISDIEKIKLEDFNLGDYYCDFYYDENGDRWTYDKPQTPTLLQLFIYSMEEYCSDGWDVTVSGGQESIYLANGFWHHDENLLYYVNGKYPLYYKGWGATCSGIILKPGDFVDVTMYSDWNFYHDSAAGFHYFLDENDQPAHVLTAGEKEDFTVKFGRAMGNIDGGEDTSIEAEGNYEIYLQPANPGNHISFDPEKATSYTTDQKGRCRISGLEAGSYYLWAYGGYGADAGTEGSIVSSPAYCKLVICDHEGGEADCSHKAICDKCHEEYGTFNESKHGSTIHLDAKLPTCGADGYEAHDVCADCGKALSSYQTYQATGNHTLDYVPYKKAEMGVPGNKEHYKCSVCGKRYYDAAGTQEAKDVVIPQIVVHDHEKFRTTTIHETAATCTTDGCTAEIICSYPGCDHVFQTSEVITRKGHVMNHVEAKNATTTTEGNIEYYTCKTCGRCYADKEGKGEITKESIVIPRLPEPEKSEEKANPVVKLNAASIKLKVKQSTTAVKVTLQKGDKVKSWQSSNSKIATVTKAGKITAKKVGKCTLTVTTEQGAKATLKVTVQKTAVATSSITASKVTVKKGKKAKITYKRSPITCVQKITYRVANKKIATVSSKGHVKGKKKGTTTITLKSGKKKAKIKVVVK